MLPIAFKALGEPKSQPRVKARNCGKFVHIYTPATAKVWKGLVAKAAGPFCVSGPLTGALALTLAFQFVRPKSHLTTKGALCRGVSEFHDKKPDADNLAKAVMDSLTDCGLWKDDDQIVNLTISKRYGKKEGVSVQVTEATPDHVPEWDI